MATMTLTIFLSTLHGYQSSLKEVQQLFDDELAIKARLLAITGNHLPFGDEVYSVPGQYAFQVWQDGQSLQRSDNTPVTAIAELETGYGYANFGRYRWRTFTFPEPGGKRVAITAERVDIRNALAERIILKSVIPVVLALPVAGLLIWLIVGYGLAPLRNLAASLRIRRAEDLSPLLLDHQPVELKQVVSSTNDLLGRLEGSFAREKQFASDAAHEMRTPISALKVHLHNLSQGLPGEDHDLVQLKVATVRMGNLVDQILSLYRTSPDQYMARFREIDLYLCAQEMIVTLYPEFDGKNIQLELTGTHALMQGDRFALDTLMKNLLDNACKYAPSGGQVHVDITADKSCVILLIEDSGPGVPEEQYQRIFDRFYRLGGDQHETGVVGCGLGLAIVRHIADLHGAEIELQKSSFESGLAIRVCFPRRPGPQRKSDRHEEGQGHEA